MSLRRSPLRTAALLAANRRNALRSTGPRTPDGKRRAALNSLRHGRRAERLMAFLAQAAPESQPDTPLYGPDFRVAPTFGSANAGLKAGAAGPIRTAPAGPTARQAAELLALYDALHAALLPDPKNDQQMRYLRRATVSLWTWKRRIARLAASPSWRRLQFSASRGVFPAPFRYRVKRSGWRVTVSLWVRRGRGRAHCRVRPAYGWQEGRARLHAGVSVTSSMRHPVEGYPSLDRLPPGIAPRVTFRTKPEYYRKHDDSESVITIRELQAARYTPDDEALGRELDGGLATGIGRKVRRLVRAVAAAVMPSWEGRRQRACGPGRSELGLALELTPETPQARSRDSDGQEQGSGAWGRLKSQSQGGRL